MTKFLLALALFLSVLVTAIPLHAGSKPVSDDLIYDNMKRKLAIDPVVKGGALEIDVKEGAVVLRGNLDSEKRKEKAEKIARKVAGVKSVDNQIKVVEK